MLCITVYYFVKLIIIIIMIIIVIAECVCVSREPCNLSSVWTEFRIALEADRTWDIDRHWGMCKHSLPWRPRRRGRLFCMKFSGWLLMYYFVKFVRSQVFATVGCICIKHKQFEIGRVIGQTRKLTTAEGERIFSPAYEPKEEILSSDNMLIEWAVIEAVKQCSKSVECVFQIDQQFTELS